GQHRFPARPRATGFAREKGHHRLVSPKRWCGDSERKGLHHSLPRLLEGALLRRQRLLLALDRRLLVVLALPDLAQDACLLALLLEALHGVFERLAFLDAHARHSRNHHPSRDTRVPRLFESARVYARSEECQTLFGSAVCGARLAEKMKSY